MVPNIFNLIQYPETLIKYNQINCDEPRSHNRNYILGIGTHNCVIKLIDQPHKVMRLSNIPETITIETLLQKHDESNLYTVYVTEIQKKCISMEQKQLMENQIDELKDWYGWKKPIYISYLPYAGEFNIADLIIFLYDNKHKFTLSEFASITNQMINVVNFMHQTIGYVHGDLKLDNFVINENGLVRLIDFDFTRPISDYKDLDDDGQINPIARDIVNARWSLGRSIIELSNSVDCEDKQVKKTLIQYIQYIEQQGKIDD